MDNIINKEKISEDFEKDVMDQTGFDLKSFNEVIQLQNDLNVKVDPDWIKNKLNWELAIFLESAELIDSTDWKWWKKGETDWKNIEIELIDIWHFLIAKLIEQKQTNILPAFLIAKDLENKNMSHQIKDEALSKDLVERLMCKFNINVLQKNLLGYVIPFVEIWYILGYDSNDLFKLYRMKYALNIFRQNHGYKTGEYIKIWNGREDNVVAQEIIKTLDNDKFIENLTSQLEIEYAKVGPVEKKNIESFLNQDEKWKQLATLMPDESKAIMFQFAKQFETYISEK